MRGGRCKARAVLIVPRLLKGGFVVAGEGGQGVLLVRGPCNTRNNPAFYGIGSVSFGLQAGLSRSPGWKAPSAAMHGRISWCGVRPAAPMRDRAERFDHQAASGG
jgi:hypothetical protein